MMVKGKLKELKAAAMAKPPKSGSKEERAAMGKLKAGAKERATKMLKATPIGSKKK